MSEKSVAYMGDRERFNPSIEKQPSIAGEKTISHIEVESRVMSAREGQYYALVHIAYEGGHLNYSSPRVSSVGKAEAIASTAAEMFTEILRTVLNPPT